MPPPKFPIVPNDPSEAKSAATAFVTPAKAYIRWFEETAAADDRAADMSMLHDILGRLQIAAAVLSAWGPTGNESGQDATTDRNAAAVLASKVESKLPVNAYIHVFDPLKDKEGDSLHTRLGDDLRDIYSDLKNGLAEYDAGNYQDALWLWHNFYYVHWGRHLIHAQTAIWQYLAEGNWR